MKYFKFTADTPFSGTENEYFYELGDEYATPTYLNRLAEELARDNGEGYEYLVFGWDSDPVEEGEMTEEEYDEEIANYYGNCSCTWEEISQEEYEEETGNS